MLFREMLRDEREEGREEGRIDGQKEMIIEFLSESGEVPKDIHEQIMRENNESVLKKWIRSAAKAESFDEFRQSM